MTYIVMIICYQRAICARVERCKRAKVVIITKCPSGLAIEEQDSIRMKLNLDKSQELYFSFIKYDDFVFSEHDSITLEKIKRQPKLLVAGIAKPDSFRLYKSKEDICLSFQITTILLLLILQRLKQSWKQYNCDYRKDYVRKR
jgi:hypothetical protein